MSGDWEPGHRRPPTPDDDPLDPGLDSGADDTDDAPGAGTSRLLWLVGGAAAIAAGTALGWDSSAMAAVVNPPPLIRPALIGLGVAVGVVLLLGALERLGAPAASRGRSTRDIATMIRGVRLVFLAVAAFVAASTWLVGHPLPLVIALVIAGVDVLETSFLLLVVNLRSRS
ncbi:MAG: hypothetical protein H0U52_08510 [Chloroflexi bacterium]|nr:hypothetical protein [Chloroflexota bacterium]